LFAAALQDVLAEWTPAAGSRITSVNQALTALLAGVQAGEDAILKQRKTIGDWFDAAMSSVGGAYKRRAHLIVAVLAVVVTATTNAAKGTLNTSKTAFTQHGPNGLEAQVRAVEQSRTESAEWLTKWFGFPTPLVPLAGGLEQKVSLGDPLLKDVKIKAASFSPDGRHLAVLQSGVPAAQAVASAPTNEVVVWRWPDMQIEARVADLRALVRLPVFRSGRILPIQDTGHRLRKWWKGWRPARWSALRWHAAAPLGRREQRERLNLWQSFHVERLLKFWHGPTWNGAAK